MVCWTVALHLMTLCTRWEDAHKPHWMLALVGVGALVCVILANFFTFRLYTRAQVEDAIRSTHEVMLASVSLTAHKEVHAKLAAMRGQKKREKEWQS